MSDVAIRIDSLGKQYRFGRRRAPNTLRDRLTHLASASWRRAASLFRPAAPGPSDNGPREGDLFWALNDVSFEVKEGEAVGIIGRNGAGKSTLLKVLSRITEPTTGEVELYGRVASLLEVGTGFHPELTGRENVFLNGAILGMARAEIARKFDEIVAFAEVEKFIDTPVKHYSSGMYMRLAFAVAAHLDPEILVVDEVLAVGDVQFQTKCLGRMSEVAGSGRTVLFVSHNLAAVSQLCDRGVLLDRGEVAAAGGTDEVISAYMKTGDAAAHALDLPPGHGEAYFEAVTACDGERRPTREFRCREPVGILMKFTVKRAIPGLHVCVALFNAWEEKLFWGSHRHASPRLLVEKPGTYVVCATIPGTILLPGTYSANVALELPDVQMFDLRRRVVTFEVSESGWERYEVSGRARGCVAVDLGWEMGALPSV